MNPLTQVKNVQKITAREAAAGISDDASWHAKYKESAYVFVGGLSYDLTEGDLLAVFSQYGEIVDVNLVRDKATGKSKGFAFLAYQDQRSTILAVDNLNGATIVGRTVRVDHVANYKRKREEDEEEEKRKREERGVCYAFQKGECQRGAACRFSHDEERNANTGWGGKDNNPRWEHDRYEVASQRHHHKKLRYDRGSREASGDGDNRSRLAGKSDQRSEDGQDRNFAAIHEEANTKDVGRWSKHDERRESRNKLKDEKVGFVRPIDCENHYMDTAPGRKRDYNEKGFDPRSRDAGKSGQRSKSEDRQDRHVATRHAEAKTKDDGRWSKYDDRRADQNRLRDEKEGITRPKEAENRSMDTMPNRARAHDERGFDSGSTHANEKDGDKRSRDCSRRDYDRSKKDGDKRSRDHSTREHDGNVRDNDRREAKYYHG